MQVMALLHNLYKNIWTVTIFIIYCEYCECKGITYDNIACVVKIYNSSGKLVLRNEDIPTGVNTVSRWEKGALNYLKGKAIILNYVLITYMMMLNMHLVKTH